MCTNKTLTARSTIIIGMFLLHAIATAGWAGEFVAWGQDIYGQVSQIPLGNDFKAVAVGGGHSVALKTDGSLIAWGADFYGQISDTPSGNGFDSVTAGASHNLALKSDGSLVAWGNDSNGQVSNTPTGNDFKAVASGYYHNVALKNDGSLIAWGSDRYGQVNNTPAGYNFQAVAAGYNHNVALKSDGSLIAWGMDNNGSVSDTPVGYDFIAIASGGWHCVALKSDGSLISWGNDTGGQVTNTPSGNEFIAVAAGEAHSVALKSDGSLVAWGWDRYGQISNTPAGNDFTAITTRSNNNIAIRDTVSPPPMTYTLITSVSPSGSGSVTKNPNKTNYSSNESVQLTAVANSGYTFSYWSGDASGSSNPVTITMNSNKNVTANFIAIKPTVSIVSTDALAGEPANNGSFTVSRTGATSNSLRVYYSTSGSTASAGTDYAALPGYVDIPAGQSSSVISVAVIDDIAMENSETVQLTISSNEAYTIGSPSSAAVTIADNDQPVDNPIVTITAPYASAAEPAIMGYFTVSRTGATSGSLLVYYSTNGSASSGADYAALPGYVDFSSGQSSAVVYVIVYDDSTVENSETVQLTISSNAAYTIGSPSSATVTIADNDQAVDKPIVTITAPDASAGEPANNGSFTVSRTGATSVSLRVYYSTSGSTASPGADYTALPGYADIPAGQSSAPISVVVIDDITTENSETVQSTISSNAAYTIGSPSYATVTITDNDDIPVEKPIVSITAPNASAGEPANDGSFTISRTGATSVSLRVYYSTSGSTASSGIDYTALPGYVDIPAGQYSALVYVFVIDDTATEDPETVQLMISSNTAYTIGSPSSAAVTIADDDTFSPLVDMMADTLTFFYLSVDDGSLQGVGAGGRGRKALASMQNLLETAYALIVDGYYDDACVQLTNALSRCDGDSYIPDYVTGAATATLAGMIQEVINGLGCQ